MKTIRIEFPDGRESVIEIGVSLGHIGIRLAKLVAGKTVLVLTDTTVGRLYGKAVETSLQKAGFRTLVLTVRPGESAKTFATIERIIGACAKARMERGDTIIGLGGGVVSDLAGFAASIYLRGIRFVVAPTTLLSQVDAAIGGKTAVDLPWGKNLAGSFYQPALVYADTAALATLPAREIRQGMAEVVKYAVSMDAGLFRLLNRLDRSRLKARFADIVPACARMKAAIVGKDERERAGLREVLNFGHTLGHAIETAYRPRFSHGDAVSMGIAGETVLSRCMGLCADGTVTAVMAMLKRYDLPHDAAGMEFARILSPLRHDKKMKNGVLRFVLPRSIGDAAAGMEVPLEMVRSAWKEWIRWNAKH